MNKPSEIEIKAWLRSLAGSMSAWSERDERMSQTIRCLIEKQEAWAEEAGDMIKFFGIHLPLRVRIFLERLRDFGKETADE